MKVARQSMHIAVATFLPPQQYTTWIDHACHSAMQGGTVVNEDREFRADVLLADGLIQAVGEGLTVSPFFTQGW